MPSQPCLAQPPSVAVWLISLFTLGEEGESILGDLLEEFSLMASKSGVPSARQWYWRQTLKTVPRLASLSVCTGPWITATTILGGYLLRKLIAPLLGPPTFAVLERYQGFFEHHLSVYLFLASTGFDIEHLITFLLIGSIVAFATPGRELVTTAMFALLIGAIFISGTTLGVIRSGECVLLWRLTWSIADSLMIVVAGIIVRMHRLAAKSRLTVA